VHPSRPLANLHPTFSHMTWRTVGREMSLSNDEPRNIRHTSITESLSWVVTSISQPVSFSNAKMPLRLFSVCKYSCHYRVLTAPYPSSWRHPSGRCPCGGGPLPHADCFGKEVPTAKARYAVNALQFLFAPEGWQGTKPSPDSCRSLDTSD
jgi:hypothetical protein